MRMTPGRPAATELMLRQIRRITDASGFQSQAEIEKFMGEHVTGKTPEQVALLADQLAPPSDLERANRLIEGLDDEAAEDEIARTARAALEISPDCLGAWLQLGLCEPDPAKATECFEQGIQRGRERFADDIASPVSGPGLWGNVDARDLIRLMFHHAKLQRDLGEWDAAIETCREVIRLNPSDDCGVRGELVHLYVLRKRLADARALVDACPNDDDTAVAWGRVLVGILEAIESSGFESPDEDELESFGSAQAFLESLGPEFGQARADLRQAARINAFVPVFFTEPGLMEVETFDLRVVSGPADAIEYLQSWGVLWHVTDLPIVFLAAVSPRDVRNLLRNPKLIEEFEDIVDQLDEFEGDPWWEAFEEAEDK
jgi:tetratricopeptide (TPR) repeat protein